MHGLTANSALRYNAYILEREVLGMHYSYRCPECGVFTIEQSMKDDPISECPTCSQPVKRIIGKNINVIYKSSGFYCKDSTPCASESPHTDSSAGSPCASCEHFEAHKSAVE
jgi:putative FmdB family regulatory protein